MEKLAYYSKQKESWEPKEDEDLLKEYNDVKMDVREIADIHKRTPGSIAYRLKSLGQLAKQIDARGYQLYQQSDLYKEIANTPDSKLKAVKNVPEAFKLYTSAGQMWTEEEAKELKRRYNEEKLTLLEISNLHKRLPTAIIGRLRHDGIIDSSLNVRGHQEYKVSNIYKEIRKKNKEKTATLKNAIIENDVKEYKYTGTSWAPEEVSDLVDEYTIAKLPLLEICKLRKRTPKEVIHKICVLNLEHTETNVRGYDTYIKSKQVNNVVNVEIHKKPTGIELEVYELKAEVQMLKAQLKDLQNIVLKNNIVNTHLNPNQIKTPV